MSQIHPSAVVDPNATLGRDVQIGPYAVIDAGVQIGDRCVIGPHAVIRGPSRIGADTRIFQFASVGEVPQDKKFHGENSELVIGCHNTIREFVTINRGTSDGGGVTRIGDNNWIMAYVHIAHDCLVGDGVVFANGASLAGHVEVGDFATLGGFTLIHQFCRLGSGCFTSMGSCVRRDIPPWVMVAGDPAEPHGTNREGLRRHGFDAEGQARMRSVYRLLYKRGLRFEQAIAAIDEAHGDDPAVQAFTQFLRQSPRGIVR